MRGGLSTLPHRARGAAGASATGTARLRRTPGRTWVLATVLLLALGATRAFILTPVAVHGVSMEPTVHDGTALVVHTNPATLSRGQLVVFRDPQGSLALKRVVAVAGDRVEILDAILDVNGRPVPEPYVDHSRIDGTYFGPVTVPKGTVFVMGDNRAPSIDSRIYGPIAFDRIEGRVLLTW